MSHLRCSFSLNYANHGLKDSKDTFFKLKRGVIVIEKWLQVAKLQRSDTIYKI